MGIVQTVSGMSTHSSQCDLTWSGVLVYTTTQLCVFEYSILRPHGHRTDNVRSACLYCEPKIFNQHLKSDSGTLSSAAYVSLL